MKYFIFLFCFQLTLISEIYSGNFYSLGNGVDGCEIWALFSDTNTGLLYAGGFFNSAGGISNTECIAVWNGTQWDSLGSGVNNWGSCSDYIKAITKYQGEIWVGGGFDSIGRKKIKWAARWNGTDWNPIPGGDPDDVVRGFLVYNNELYVFGYFQNIGGIAADKIAKWNGSAWSAFPVFTSDIGDAYGCAAIYKGELYVGGNFDGTSTPYARDIVRYNFSTGWQLVGSAFSGTNSAVNDMVVYKDELIVAGIFQASEGDPGNNIAKWNGSSWSSLGSGCQPANVFALEVYNGALYAGGQINNAGGVSVTSIAKWDSIQWYGLGSTVDNSILSFAVLNNALYLGGGFWTIDGDSVHQVAKYDPLVNVAEQKGNSYLYSGFQVFPNPVNSSATVALNSFTSNENYTLVVSDIAGRKIKTFSFTQSVITIRTGGLDNGIYFLTLYNGYQFAGSKKLVVAR